MSDDFWQQFGVQKKALKKQVGLYEIENLNKPNIITIAINPKEYFEKYIDKSINKKHKGVKKGLPGMDFEAYSARILPKEEFNADQKIIQKRFQIKSNAMQMIAVNKVRFASLNEKRFYIMDGILSLPFGHFLLKKARDLKEKYRLTINKDIEDQVYNFIWAEAEALHKCKRLGVLYQIFKQPPIYYLLNSTSIVKGSTFKSTKEQI